MVVDVGNWDPSRNFPIDYQRMTNAHSRNSVRGQSGDPRSKFYDNLLENWANDEDLPMLFSKGRSDRSYSLTMELGKLPPEARKVKESIGG